MIINEQADLATLAGTVKKKVHGLLGIYALLILGTILLFLIVTGLVIVIEWGLASGGTIYGRAVVLGLMIIGAAGYCLVIVLKPVFKIFEKKKEKGVEINRKDYPELFALIDEVVKDVDCLEPKHVRVSNECNAYVYHPSLLGYIISGRQNLTIGLPLICMMNKTELKSILAHEFGHFTQKSVSTNRIANLSEFICASIARSESEIDQTDDVETGLIDRSKLEYRSNVSIYIQNLIRRDRSKITAADDLWMMPTITYYNSTSGETYYYADYFYYDQSVLNGTAAPRHPVVTLTYSILK